MIKNKKKKKKKKILTPKLPEENSPDTTKQPQCKTLLFCE